MAVVMYVVAMLYWGSWANTRNPNARKPSAPTRPIARRHGQRCARNISELCKSLICRHSFKNAGEVFLVVFFIGERDFNSMSVDLSGRNFAKTIAKDLGAAYFCKSLIDQDDVIVYTF